MTTEEGNKLIAEFMGWYKSPYPNTPTSMYLKVPEIGEIGQSISGLSYHQKWDILMPVVEKIRELGFKFIIGDSNRVTVYNKDYDWRNGSTSDLMLDCVWHGCVQFIKWYNKNVMV